MSQYIQKPGRVTFVILLAARDGKQLLHKRTQKSEAKAALIPELFDALGAYGRHCKTGEAPTSCSGSGDPLEDHAPMLSGLILTSGEAPPQPPLDRFVTSGAKSMLDELRLEGEMLMGVWNAFIALQMPVVMAM